MEQTFLTNDGRCVSFGGEGEVVTRDRYSQCCFLGEGRVGISLETAITLYVMEMGICDRGRA